MILSVNHRMKDRSVVEGLSMTQGPKGSTVEGPTVEDPTVKVQKGLLCKVLL